MPQGGAGAMNRMMNSGTNTKQRRVVSETKKKYVASQQNWKCKNCSDQLSYTFEIDHRIPLESGGSNTYDQLLKPFGLNPKRKDFWQKGINVIENLIDQLEE